MVFKKEAAGNCKRSSCLVHCSVQQYSASTYTATPNTNTYTYLSPLHKVHLCVFSAMLHSKARLFGCVELKEIGFCNGDGLCILRGASSVFNL